ncbi:MAG: SDR family oxidoreductase [Chitinophagaceae bacterium]|nr:SDR family oxidoreductase [Chitinophagaceae bacterium]
MSRKILITGANGFVGTYLSLYFSKNNYTVFTAGKGMCRIPQYQSAGICYHETDCTQKDSVLRMFSEIRPDVVIHSAAMSKPDDCELNPTQAFDINVNAVSYITEAASVYKSYLIQISTDFVFDGEKDMYQEDDIPGPVNYYGHTKRLAEEIVQQYPYNRAIIRTALVYGLPVSGRDNLLTRVQSKLSKNESYAVVTDQRRTPTYVEDLVRGIDLILMKNATGIFHISGKEVFTPYEMAVKTAQLLNLPSELLKPVTSATLNEPAKRPRSTVLNISKAETELGYRPVSFDEGLQQTFFRNPFLAHQ